MAEMNGDVIEQLVQEVFEDRDGLKRLLEALLQATMQSEVSRHIGAEPHQRCEGRTGHRNGTKPRKVNTRIGELDLQIPQVRGCDPYHPSMFNKWQRSELCWWPAVRCIFKAFQRVMSAMFWARCAAVTSHRLP